MISVRNPSPAFGAPRPFRGLPSTPAFGHAQGGRALNPRSPSGRPTPTLRPTPTSRGKKPRRPPAFCPEPLQCPGQPERRSIRKAPPRRPGGRPMRWPIFRRPRSRAVQLPIAGPSKRPMIVCAPGFSPTSPKGLGSSLPDFGRQNERPVPSPRNDARHAFDPGLNSPAIGWVGTPSIAGPALTRHAVHRFAAATPWAGWALNPRRAERRRSRARRKALLPSLPLQGLRRTSHRHRPLIGPAATGSPPTGGRWSAASLRRWAHQRPGRRRQLNSHRWRLVMPSTYRLSPGRRRSGLCPTLLNRIRSQARPVGDPRTGLAGPGLRPAATRPAKANPTGPAPSDPAAPTSFDADHRTRPQ
jgi:hypothetical protein